MGRFEKVEFFNVGRENYYTQECDKLCNECLDAKGYKAFNYRKE